jgi:putative transposase
LVPAGFTGPLRGAARTGSARILRARSNPARRRVRSRRLPGAASRSLREPHRFWVARSAPLDPNTRSQLSYPLAGRVFVAAPDGTITKQVTGLGWRHEVSAQVFEEAAVDLGRALSAYSSNSSETHRDRVGFPRWKRKGRCRDSFRLRNKQSKGGGCSIRVGEGHPRSVTPPTIGMVRVHDDTRRLRRLLRPVAQLDPATGQPKVAPRAKILFAMVSRHGSRWYVSLNVQAPDLHANRRHLPRPAGDEYGFVGEEGAARPPHTRSSDRL